MTSQTGSSVAVCKNKKLIAVICLFVCSVHVCGLSFFFCVCVLNFFFVVHMCSCQVTRRKTKLCLYVRIDFVTMCLCLCAYVSVHSGFFFGDVTMCLCIFNVVYVPGHRLVRILSLLVSAWLPLSLSPLDLFRHLIGLFWHIIGLFLHASAFLSLHACVCHSASNSEKYSI